MTLLFPLVRLLKSDPFQNADFTYPDSKGRSISGLIVGIYCILYWVDHGEKEIKITKIRFADK